MTKREFFEHVIANESNGIEVIEFARGEIAKADERNAKRKGQPSKSAKANEPIKAEIVEVLKGSTEPLYAEQILPLMSEEYGLPKVRSLCTRLATEGILAKSKAKVEIDGKKVERTVFSIA